MHVVMVVSQDRGGLPHYAAELANAVAANHRVTVLKPSPSDADGMFSAAVETENLFRAAELSQARVRKHGLEPMTHVRGLVSYHKLRVVDSLEPDVVHFVTNDYPHTALFSRWVGLDERYPILVTEHGVRTEAPGPGQGLVGRLRAVAERFLPEMSTDHRIVHTEGNRETLVGRGVDPESISVIPHGTYEHFASYDHSDTAEDPDSALLFGNIVPDGGIETVLEAVPAILDRHPSFTLTIAGEGEIPGHLTGILDEYEESITYRDEYVPNEEVGALFERAAIVLSPHVRQTGHSGTVSIAYSFGTPVVASSVGDFERIVADAGAGMTVPPEDPAALASAVVTMLQDTKRREEMGHCAVEMAERFSWRNVAKLHDEAYQTAADSAIE